MIFEHRKVLNFLIYSLLIIFDKEIDEDSITRLISHAMLCVVHLILDLKLFIDHFLELVTIFEADKSIMENSEDFMAP